MTLRVLAVDDVAPALAELSRLLAASSHVREVVPAGDALSALKLIKDARFDAVFLDISMPGMDGLELAGVLARMTDPPELVFVTAFEEHAVSAYGVGALDYLLKPVARERLDAALARIVRVARPAAAQPPPPAVDELAAVSVELGGRTRYVRRADVRFAEAQGDYVRLHTRGGSHLVRMPISRLEEHWAAFGYVRVHRSFLLAVPAVQELRSDASGGLLAHTDAGDVPVSRRHARDLRDRLLEAAQRGDFAGGAR
ncbi:LytTR family DNA-binding domain-containing protein [Pseudonocardia sp. WMMC193]|uniref:LytR/AlgR family response regulator transcription factor n=1 Tax=Pseudonocardia sp. WMMC193 TaxID=2911965 RepID=UPI001F2D7C9C|nr:LytTR family DNA-binding domain-containing protein [Pseudonocardia sp. WMMC193]MCF7551075.1 LytTR family DNA-binding domain-containing protein [Pseudonocardia sp. WMMC193]